MLLLADEVENGGTIETDLCIVGAGAAGLSIALEFAHTSTRVCLLESGGFDLDPETQLLYEGEVVGPQSPELTVNRLRFFGGTTNHWSGTSRPFDPLDFEARPHVPNSGWPFKYEELAPYYARAARLMQISAPFEGEVPGGPAPLTLGSPWLNATQFFRINPLRFGEAYREAIESAPNITAVLNANVVDIETSETAASVIRLRVATLAGRRFWAKARAYVLATGGLENPRLLLNATAVERDGLGNRYGNVGRYFQDHANVYDSGRIVFTSEPRSLPFYMHLVNDDEIGQHGIFWPTEAAQRKWEMLNCAVWLRPIASPAVQSLRHVAKHFGRATVPDDFDRHVAEIVTGLDQIVTAASRRLLGVGSITVGTWYLSECSPDPDSRVTLIDERDALGLRRIRVDWRVPESYVRTYVRMHQLLGEAIGQAGLGRLKVHHTEAGEDPRLHAASSAHHTGTTRMHVDPHRGVVNADCRIHGIENLYIAGGSVFPTSGHSAVTFTLVALAIRLADHLKEHVA